MKKKVSLSGILVILIFLFSGCGVSNIANENELIEMLSAKYPECLQRYIYQDEVFEVDNLETLRRQTNREEKNDNVECKLTVHNDYYEGVFHYTLYLNYYDEGGWQIDSYEHCGTDKLKAKSNTIPSEIISNEVSHYNEFYGNLTFIDESFDSDKSIVTRIYSVKNEFPYLTAIGNLRIQYELCEENQENGFSAYSWVATYLDDVKQEWHFNGKYKLNLRNQSKIPYEEKIPIILGGDDIPSYTSRGITYIDSIYQTEEILNMEAEVYINDIGVAGGNSSYSSVPLTFDLKNHQYTYRVFDNQSGDYFSISIDKNDGISLTDYYKKNNETQIYKFIKV